jgi:hypothetical protein
MKGLSGFSGIIRRLIVFTGITIIITTSICVLQWC